MATHEETLRAKIQDRSALVGVIGLGYVGLPLALTFHEVDFPILGFDIDPAKVEQLARGENYLAHFASEQITGAAESDSFAATSDFERLSEPDALLICVPTPLTSQKDPDLSFVQATVEAVARTLRPGQLVVLESTTYPGTTEELVRSLLDGAGLECGRDYFLAYSPEREDPGNREFTTSNIPKIVAGVDPASTALAEALYAAIVPRVVTLPNPRTAEATKLTENIFRAVNIALVNELKLVYERMGIDIWDVLDAAETKPFGFMRFNPGPGWGGHCIPVDPFYLSWKAREFGVTPHFIERAGEVNIRMPDYVVERLATALDRRGVPLSGASILLLGMAYKKNVGDTRESPGLEILDRLQDRGCEAIYHDPHVLRIPSTRHHPDKEGLRSVELTPDLLESVDAVIVVTDHDAVDYEMVRQHAGLIVDTRGLFRGADGRVIQA